MNISILLCSYFDFIEDLSIMAAHIIILLRELKDIGTGVFKIHQHLEEHIQDIIN